MIGMQRFRSNLAQMAAMAGKANASTRIGLVTSYDPDRYAVKIELQPDATETGWCPIMTLMAGQGWGVYFGPAKGDQAIVIFMEGDSLAGLCVGFLPSDEDVPPRVEAGELHLIHKDDAHLKFLAGGLIQSKGTWEHEGPFSATGDVLDNSATNAATMKVHRDAYNGHAHGGVEPGAGTSEVTDTLAE